MGQTLPDTSDEMKSEVLDLLYPFSIVGFVSSLEMAWDTNGGNKEALQRLCSSKKRYAAAALSTLSVKID